MNIAALIARAWNAVTVDQYARKKSFSPMLFTDDGNAKWDESAHPRVAKGSAEAHGGQFTSKPSGIAMPEKPKNEDAKPGDQMGLFGEADRAKKPAFQPLVAKGKQQALFDTKGDKDQMMMFDDGVTPEDRLLKPEAKGLEDMSADELEKHIASQPKGGFATQFKEDWGSNRGQGKRMGGMVRGAMADPPKGIKTYTNQFGKLPEDEQQEANGLESHLGGHYAQARNAGLSHDNAMVWAYEKNGEVEKGFTHNRIKNPPKEEAKPEVKPEPNATPKPKAEPGVKSVPVGELREQVSALGDQIRSVQSSANQQERAREIEHLQRKLDQVKGLTSSRASDFDKQSQKNLIERAQAMVDNADGGKTLPKDEKEQREKARERSAKLDPVLLKLLGKDKKPEKDKDWQAVYDDAQDQVDGEPDEDAPKANPFRERANALDRKAGQLSPMGDSRSKAMASAFPFGTGNPGNASSRRTNKQSAKHIDRSIDNAKKSLEVSAQAKQVHALADQFDNGMINEHGGRTEKGKEFDRQQLAKVEEKQALRKSADEHLADHMRSTLKPGDSVFIADNPRNSVIVKRVNAKSISTESGSTWKYSELIPRATEEHRPMSTKEMADVIKARMRDSAKPEKYSVRFQPLVLAQ